MFTAILLTIACMVQAVISEASTLPVPCRRFRMNGVMSLKPDTKESKVSPPSPAYISV